MLRGTYWIEWRTIRARQSRHQENGFNQRSCMRSHAIKYNLRVKQRFYARLSSWIRVEFIWLTGTLNKSYDIEWSTGARNGEERTKKTKLCLEPSSPTKWNFVILTREVWQMKNWKKLETLRKYSFSMLMIMQCFFSLLKTNSRGENVSLKKS